MHVTKVHRHHRISKTPLLPNYVLNAPTTRHEVCMSDCVLRTRNLSRCANLPDRTRALRKLGIQILQKLSEGVSRGRKHVTKARQHLGWNPASDSE